ncbi:hypothetical protein [Coralloluteibacterium stylophorae]|uniref:Transmembrane protein n=1 Tax=Coralloluteibacterium stylophorae TaxID=1776034 RepID=A0A8J8AW44_9GAMM|nr:hypothetical protein [Coralloluteibacterium stylophorae]MBS7455527.1 hypothetical protein [Coralloluteibacterium stylophorae]
MSSFAELNLAVVLFLPWFLVLGLLFWRYPRPPRRAARRRAFDIAALSLAAVASVVANHWSYRLGALHPDAGAIWKQVLASLVAYGAFLAVLAAAWPLRTGLVSTKP